MHLEVQAAQPRRAWIKRRSPTVFVHAHSHRHLRSIPNASRVLARPASLLPRSRSQERRMHFLIRPDAAGGSSAESPRIKRSAPNSLYLNNRSFTQISERELVKWRFLKKRKFRRSVTKFVTPFSLTFSGNLFSAHLSVFLLASFRSQPTTSPFAPAPISPATIAPIEWRI